MNIRKFQWADFDGLLDFLARVYPDRADKAKEAYFRWRFDANPLGSALGSYWLATEKNEIIGQLGALRDRLYVDGRWHDAHWLVDLIVAPEHRGGLLALELFRAAMADASLLLATGVAPRLLRLYESLGYSRQPIADSYYFPIHPGRLRRLAESSDHVEPALSGWQAVFPLADVFTAGLQRLREKAGRRRNARFVVERFEHFGKEIDSFIENVLPNLGATEFRSAELLNWKFEQRPCGENFLFAARSVTDQSLVGYVAAKRMQRVESACWLEVVDYLVAGKDGAVFDELVASVESQALSLDVDFVRFRFSLPAHKRRLRAPWWLKRTAPVLDDVFVFAADKDLQHRLTNGSWHLTALAADRADYGRDDPPRSGSEHP